MATRILLLEDDANLGMVLQEHLTLNGFEVVLCVDGEDGLVAFLKGGYDLCLVDVMMPRKDGFSFARDVRERDSRIPLIFLTAKSLKEDRIKGFKLGCDDYITKPFSIEELLLRIQVLLKRVQQAPAPTQTRFRIGAYEFDANRRILILGDSEQRLTSRESELLAMLCQHCNRTLPRAMALREIWDDDGYFAGRSMDVYISKLRRYLKLDSSVEILSIHGEGFRLAVPEE